MGSKFDYENKFDRAQQRAQKRNDEIVRKFRHKKQNVFKRGEIFRVDLVGLYYKNAYGVYRRFFQRGTTFYPSVRSSPGQVLVIAMTDSDQCVTHEEVDIFRGFEGLKPPYHMWPFLYENEVVWFVIQNSRDPMVFLRGMFTKLFKIVK